VECLSYGNGFRQFGMNFDQIIVRPSLRACHEGWLWFWRGKGSQFLIKHVCTMYRVITSHMHLMFCFMCISVTFQPIVLYLHVFCSFVAILSIYIIYVSISGLVPKSRVLQVEISTSGRGFVRNCTNPYRVAKQSPWLPRSPFPEFMHPPPS
jgi:hypothetical protein